MLSAQSNKLNAPELWSIMVDDRSCLSPVIEIVRQIDFDGLELLIEI
jgi:hypothetical protein